MNPFSPAGRSRYQRSIDAHGFITERQWVALLLGFAQHQPAPTCGPVQVVTFDVVNGRLGPTAKFYDRNLFVAGPTPLRLRRPPAGIL